MLEYLDETYSSPAGALGRNGSLNTRYPDMPASGTITTQNLNASTGAATPGSAVQFAIDLNARENLAIQVTGTYTGVLTPQVSVDGTNWVGLGAACVLNVATAAQAATIASASVGIFLIDIGAMPYFRLVAQAAVTGSAVVTMRASVGGSLVALDTALPAGTNAIGALAAPPASGGFATHLQVISAATTNGALVKASAAVVGHIQASNSGASAAYVKLYNKATAPTVGTDTPLKIFMIPAGASIELVDNDVGLRFATGLGIAITGAAAITDTTAVALAQVLVNVAYT